MQLKIQDFGIVSQKLKLSFWEDNPNIYHPP